MIAAVAGTLLVSYLCGSLPWGLWLGRWFRGVDVRTVGSGNLGATNVLRSLGRTLGVATLVLDMAKGALPVALLPRTAWGDAFPGGPFACGIAAAVAAVLGHMFTVFAGFRGGKGVATTAGVVLALFPAAFGLAALAFVLVVARWRYISLGSIVAAVVFAAAVAVLARGPLAGVQRGFALAIAALVVLRHRDNIARLRQGTERRFSWGAGRAGAR